MIKEKFSVSGMTCTACSSGIERTLNKTTGVVKAEVFLMNESMTVEYDEEKISREEIIAAVKALGYGAALYDEKTEKNKISKASVLKKRFFLSLIFLVPLMYCSMGGMIGLPVPSKKLSYAIQGVLSLFVICINFKFFTNGTRALFKQVPNMDTLVSLGSAVSFVYSAVLTVFVYAGKLHHAHMFYESAAMILTLVTLGKWLEEKSAKKTGEEVEKLIKLMPDTVSVEKAGKIVILSYSDLQKGDILVVKQGDFIPVDGVVVDGHASLDRAAVTGESMPVEVEIGNPVTGADIVKSGFLKIKAEKVGKDTTLSQIVKMVKEAGASKAPLQKIADKISGVFVPAVTFIAAVTFLIWYLVSGDISKSANFAISVLVISCPCSLGLATPVAVMAATGRGMALGVLFKDAESLQKAEKINCAVLDKTATLTIGAPKVTDFELYIGEKRETLEIAYAMEEQSNHPIADCIQSFVESELTIKAAPALKTYEYHTGKGGMAQINGRKYFLGNPKLLPEQLKKRAKGLEEKFAESGKTAVFLADEKSLIATFAVSDPLKENSKEGVEGLKRRFVRVAMLTGDNEKVAKTVAKEVGIDDYFAEALPKDKAESVKRLQEVGGFVAMVGDGINDSPALKQADLGIAMGTGTDIAIDSADIVLVRGDIQGVSDAIDLSKAAVKNIKQNLFWAFFYNCVAIPVAAGAFAFLGISLNPMIAAAAMSCSSLFVVGNALRLTRFKREQNQKDCDGFCPIAKENEKIKEDGMTYYLTVEGMMCQHCVMHVKKALESIEGVLSVEVDLSQKKATVRSSGTISFDTFKTAIEEAGYELIDLK